MKVYWRTRRNARLTGRQESFIKREKTEVNSCQDPKSKAKVYITAHKQLHKEFLSILMNYSVVQPLPNKRVSIASIRVAETLWLSNQHVSYQSYFLI